MCAIRTAISTELNRTLFDSLFEISEYSHTPTVSYFKRWHKSILSISYVYTDSFPIWHSYKHQLQACQDIGRGRSLKRSTNELAQGGWHTRRRCGLMEITVWNRVSATRHLAKLWRWQLVWVSLMGLHLYMGRATANFPLKISAKLHFYKLPRRFPCHCRVVQRGQNAYIVQVIQKTGAKLGYIFVHTLAVWEKCGSQIYISCCVFFTSCLCLSLFQVSAWTSKQLILYTLSEEKKKKRGWHF